MRIIKRKVQLKDERSMYRRAVTIDPEHLDAVIGLLTVARDKIVGARP